MYETFYNLRAEPFRLSPDHRFCYVHKGYSKARAYMAYAFMRAEGFVMITGRPGTGKTTLIGDLIESLAKDNVTTANLVCTQLQADDLLKTVAYSFNVGTPEGDKAELLQRLNVLFHKWHRDGRRALLIVDEAQDLSATAMEELRLLTNIQQDGQPLLQIFLLGQPELRDLILSPQLEQVHQRIVAASHLECLESNETEEYVRHRLDAVGWRGDPALSKAIFPLIYKFSEGVPRRINLICSRLLLHGSVEQRHAIGVQDIRTVIMELQGENLAAGSKFSEDDFELEDEFEEISHEMESAAVQAPAEVHLRAVVNESFSAAGDEPHPVEPEAGRKAVPARSGISDVRPADKDVGEAESTADADYPPGEKKPTESEARSEHVYASPMSLQVEVVQPQADISEQAEREPAAVPPVVPAKTQGRRKQSHSGSRVSSTLVILLVSLGIILGYLTLKEGAWAQWQSKSLEIWSDLRESLSVTSGGSQAPGTVYRPFSDAASGAVVTKEVSQFLSLQAAALNLAGAGMPELVKYDIFSEKYDCDTGHTV